MKTSIEVESRREGELIKAGLDDPTVRAFVQVIGALAPLSDRAKRRVMTYMQDKFDEQNEAANG